MALSFVLPVWFVVIVSPYRYLRPGRIDTYHYNQSYKIKVWTPEPEKRKPVIKEAGPLFGPWERKYKSTFNFLESL